MTTAQKIIIGVLVIGTVATFGAAIILNSFLPLGILAVTALASVVIAE